MRNCTVQQVVEWVLLIRPTTLVQPLTRSKVRTWRKQSPTLNLSLNIWRIRIVLKTWVLEIFMTEFLARVTSVLGCGWLEIRSNGARSFIPLDFHVSMRNRHRSHYPKRALSLRHRTTDRRGVLESSQKKVGFVTNGARRNVKKPRQYRTSSWITWIFGANLVADHSYHDLMVNFATSIDHF